MYDDFNVIDKNKILKIYEKFFSYIKYSERRNPEFFDNDYNGIELIAELNEAIDILKKYVNNEKEV